MMAIIADGYKVADGSICKYYYIYNEMLPIFCFSHSAGHLSQHTSSHQYTTPIYEQFVQITVRETDILLFLSPRPLSLLLCLSLSLFFTLALSPFGTVTLSLTNTSTDIHTDSLNQLGRVCASCPTVSRAGHLIFSNNTRPILFLLFNLNGEISPD